jgi:hypothetical protein
VAKLLLGRDVARSAAQELLHEIGSIYAAHSAKFLLSEKYCTSEI